MNSDENTDRVMTADDLTDASLEAVLLYGLTLGGKSASRSVLQGAKGELSLLVSLSEIAQVGVGFELGELAPVLEGIVRRIEVALLLMDRGK